MEDRVNLAVQKHKEGYNCAQAVICAYCDLFGMDEKTAYKMSEGFGAGMGGLMDTCGAVTAMFMLEGLKRSNGELDAPGKTKGATYRGVKELANAFKEKNSTLLCRELKGITDGVVKRSCDGCIEDAARLVEKYLLSKDM